jgi:serine/threonine protein kinase
MDQVIPGELRVGATFNGRYRVLRRIRAGGMGAIYEVLHRETRRRRALKVMLPGLVSDPELRARFEREATIAAGIRSEHIVETIDAGVDAATGMPFLVMELLVGLDLMQLLEERGRLTGAEVVLLLGQAALALDQTHAAGVIHRDLKPQNLFLTHRDDGTPRLKVLDFGIARLAVADQSTAVLGSPLYMPPEQIRGEGTIGPPADVYALAHLAFTLLVGAPY